MANITISEPGPSSSTVRRCSVDFFGTTISVVVTSIPEVADRWLNATLPDFRKDFNPHDRTVVGFSVLWAPTTPFHPPAATLQLCLGRHCLIYQLAHAPSIPKNIRDFLVSPEVMLVGLWCHSDVGSLMASRHRLWTKEPLDLRYVLRRANGENLVDGTMEEIVATFLGFEGVISDTAIKASNWENQDLSLEQVRQASVHVYVAAAIGIEANAWSFRQC